jgi:outer membrane protein OmpA-like peptidoglycan-associated protein
MKWPGTLFFIGLSWALSGSGAEELKFKLKPGDVLAVDKYQDVAVTDGRSTVTREEKNRIVLKIESEKNGLAHLAGLFSRYARSPRRVGHFQHIQDFPSEFAIEPGGRYHVPEKVLMPNLRSMPSFPQKDLQPGDAWTERATEILDIDNKRVKVDFAVHYIYHGPAELKDENGRSLALKHITYQYSFLAPRPAAGLKAITGHSADQLWFDSEAGIPVFDTNRLSYEFAYEDGRRIHYNFKIDSWWKKFKRLAAQEKNEMRKAIASDLKNDSGVRLRENDQGIIIDLDAILFAHDSAELTPDSKSTIARVAGILGKYPEQEVRISGHTDSTGQLAYNQTLSEKRAFSVLSELVKEHGMDGKRFSYKGFAATAPVASNGTAEGRARNRRVEILIMTD